MTARAPVSNWSSRSARSSEPAGRRGRLEAGKSLAPAQLVGEPAQLSAGADHSGRGSGELAAHYSGRQRAQADQSTNASSPSSKTIGRRLCAAATIWRSAAATAGTAAMSSSPARETCTMSSRVRTRARTVRAPSVGRRALRGAWPPRGSLRGRRVTTGPPTPDRRPPRSGHRRRATLGALGSAHPPRRQRAPAVARDPRRSSARRRRDRFTPPRRAAARSAPALSDRSRMTGRSRHMTTWTHRDRACAPPATHDRQSRDRTQHVWGSEQRTTNPDAWAEYPETVYTTPPIGSRSRPG